MSRPEPILTLEPLVDAVSAALRDAGWDLSGLQKTTSHQFEGRWEGESTRSAYLFFHTDRRPDYVGIDVFLDETSRGLSGNLALVLDLASLECFDDVKAEMERLAEIGRTHLPDSLRTPISLRFRLADSAREARSAESQVRFKVRIPATTIGSGAAATRDLAVQATRAFEAIIESGGLDALAPEEE